MRRDPRRRRAVLALADSCRSGRRAPVPIRDGELGLVGRDRAKREPSTIPQRERSGTPCSPHIANERGYKPGWAAVQVQGKIRRLAAVGLAPQPIPPTPEVRSWVRSRLIAYAKSRSAAA